MEKDENAGFRITSNYDCICEKEVFEKVLAVLMTYAHSLIGNGTLRLSKGRDELAYDFAIETIKKHLESPDKFKPERNPDLVPYLKGYILRQLIYNFKKRPTQKNELAYENDDPIGLEVEASFISSNDVHDLIDLQAALELIQKQLHGKSDLLQVFNLRYEMEYTRAEVCEELNISKGEYANRIRRLETVLKKVRNHQAGK